MGLVIDPRLLEPSGEMEIIENFNRTLELIDEGGGGGSGLPEIDPMEDIGAILAVDPQGDPYWQLPVPELPDVDSEDEGKVLTVNAQGQWDTDMPASGLPEVSASDEGKFLVVNDNGEWAATTVPVADNMSF